MAFDIYIWWTERNRRVLPTIVRSVPVRISDARESNAKRLAVVSTRQVILRSYTAGRSARLWAVVERIVVLFGLLFNDVFGRLAGLVARGVMVLSFRLFAWLLLVRILVVCHLRILIVCHLMLLLM